ncbi:MAG: hypothetical protein AABW80_05585 [Nanoarchaeota archaeon]
MEEIVKMSNKGQLVVPREIRENQSLSPSDRFVAIGVKEGVLFKKVKIPNVKIEFDSLSKDIAQHFKEKQISEEDVKEAVKWGRQKIKL